MEQQRDPFFAAMHQVSYGAVGHIERQPMRAFMVCFKQRGAVVRSFEAMGTDSCTVVEQHIGSGQPGEKLDVMSLEAWREMQEREAFYREADRGYEQQKDAGFPDRYERALQEQMNRRPA